MHFLIKQVPEKWTKTLSLELILINNQRTTAQVYCGSAQRGLNSRAELEFDLNR